MTTINSSSNSYLYGQTKSLADYLTEDDSKSPFTNVEGAIASLKAESLGSSSSSANSLGSYGSTSDSAGRAALTKALDEMSLETKGPITFAKVSKYRQELEDEFSTKLRVDVALKGVDPEQAFSLKLSSEGKISVECDDDASKAVIEKYLDDNSAMCEQFGYIQALSNLERARQVNIGSTLGAALSSSATELQSSAIENFFDKSLAKNINYSSTIATFNSQKSNTSFYTGLDISV